MGGFSTGKGLTNDFLMVTPDSTKVIVDGAGGFKVKDVESGEEEEYMHLTPLNTFIGYKSGDKTVPSGNNGVYNTYIGHMTGMNNNIGSKNLFFGRKSGYNSTLRIIV